MIFETQDRGQYPQMASLWKWIESVYQKWTRPDCQNQPEVDHFFAVRVDHFLSVANSIDRVMHHLPVAALPLGRFQHQDQVSCAEEARLGAGLRGEVAERDRKTRQRTLPRTPRSRPVRRKRGSPVP